MSQIIESPLIKKQILIEKFLEENGIVIERQNNYYYIFRDYNTNKQIIDKRNSITEAFEIAILALCNLAKSKELIYTPLLLNTVKKDIQWKI